MTLGDFKQTVAQLHNEVNQRIFGQGLQTQKVEFIQDKVFIIAKNRRVFALSSLDHKDELAARMIDIALLVEFKKGFKALLEEKMSLPVQAVLKDYDPATETSICILLLKEDLVGLLERI